MDRYDLQEAAAVLCKLWRERHEAKINREIERLGHSPSWIRYGCHYFSVTLGEWLRRIRTPHEDSPGDRALPWEGQYAAIRRNWRAAYDQRPRRLNWVSEGAFERPLVLVIGPRRDTVTKLKRGATDSFVDAHPRTSPWVDFLSTKTAHAIGASYLDLEADQLAPDRVMQSEPLDVKGWTEVKKLASRIGRETGIKSWASSGVSDDARTRSFCFTLLPPLLDLVGRADDDPVMHDGRVLYYLIVPWRDHRPTGDEAELGNFALVFTAEPDAAARYEDLERVADIVQATSREAVCLNLLSHERSTATTSASVDPEIERVVRELSEVTLESLLRVDRLHSFREVLARVRSKKPQDIPFWAASEHYSSIARRTVALGQEWKDRFKKAPVDRGVETLFLFSPPGCGKETLWELLSISAVADRKVPSATDPAEHGRGMRTKGLDRYCQAFAGRGVVFPEAVLAGREFTTSADGSHFFAGAAGDGGASPEAGHLARFTLLKHPVFVDEFNTMDPKVADRFLRILAEPMKCMTVACKPSRASGYRFYLPATPRTPS